MGYLFHGLEPTVYRWVNPPYHCSAALVARAAEQGGEPSWRHAPATPRLLYQMEPRPGYTWAAAIDEESILYPTLDASRCFQVLLGVSCSFLLPWGSPTLRVKENLKRAMIEGASINKGMQHTIKPSRGRRRGTRGPDRGRRPRTPPTAGLCEFVFVAQGPKD